MNQRGILDALLRAALAAADPGLALRRVVKRNGALLSVRDQGYDLRAYRRILVVGAGKASSVMAGALESVCKGAPIPIEGVVVTKFGHATPTEAVQVMEARHPIPDGAGLRASRSIVTALSRATEEDLVFFLLSGGASALFTLPIGGLSLSGLQDVTDSLLRAGAPIEELNTVRRKLDRVKGGGASRLAPRSTLVTLVLSDVIGNRLDIIGSGPTITDGAESGSAAVVLTRFDAWHGLPAPIAERLRAADLKRAHHSIRSIHAPRQVEIIADNVAACEATVSEARRLGLHSALLTTRLRGETRDAGRLLGGVLNEIGRSGQPLPRPCCLVVGGETTVTVRGDGVGGRNQECTLAAAQEIAGVPRVQFASFGTDGGDGPTDAAGAVATGTTIQRAEQRGFSAESALGRNDSYNFFSALDDLLVTGPTGTNVGDVCILLAHE